MFDIKMWYHFDYVNYCNVFDNVTHLSHIFIIISKNGPQKNIIYNLSPIFIKFIIQKKAKCTYYKYFNHPKRIQDFSLIKIFFYRCKKNIA